MQETTASLKRTWPAPAQSACPAAHSLTSLARMPIEAALGRLRDGQVRLLDAESDRIFGREGDLSATVTVHDPAAYVDMALGGGVGAAEAYMDGRWSTDDLAALCRIFARNAHAFDAMDTGLAKLTLPLRSLWAATRKNTKAGSRRNIAAHYDLGNDFFEIFLDDTLTYSAGVFERPDATLREASVAKLDRLCRKLALGPDDHVVEIGTGWGSFALHAAGTYGCRVTTTTISRRQYELATVRVREAGLEDRVTVLLSDYRDLERRYDKLVSIEMIEAVGHEYLETFLAKCASLLRPGGAMALQAITIPDQHYAEHVRTTDFIKRYVFPGSCLVSVGSSADALGRGTDLRIHHMEEMAPHYARTLRTWRERFREGIDRVRALGCSETFVRLWDYYLAYCEAGFTERYIGSMQMVMTKPESRLAPILGPAVQVDA